MWGRLHGRDDDVSEDDLERARLWMVERQLRRRGIRDERVLAAMAGVPRERFLPPDLRSDAYRDRALPIGEGQTMSQPYIVARMTELLAPKAGQHVLEIGTGSGYQAAVLALLGCQVVSIERFANLAETARERIQSLGLSGAVEIRVGDGSIGDPAGAPWDGIIVAAAAPAIPQPLRDQLHPNGGRLVVPVGSRTHQDLMLVVRRDDEWIERNGWGGDPTLRSPRHR